MKAGLYIRISTGEQSNFSLEGQKSELMRYVQDNGLELYKIYSDQMSGLTFMEREGLQKALDDAERKMYDILLVTELDRLARDTNVIGYIKLTLHMKNIKLFAVNEPEAKTEYDELIQGVISLFSSFEAKRRKRRCIRGIAKARESGKTINRCPFGYRFDNKGTSESRVVVHDVNAQTVRKMFELRSEGVFRKSMYKIAKDMNINKASVRYILSNRYYYDENFNGKHEVIISKELYDKANRKV